MEPRTHLRPIRKQISEGPDLSQVRFFGIALDKNRGYLRVSWRPLFLRSQSLERTQEQTRFNTPVLNIGIENDPA
jgi:hypothetical protein